MTYPSRRLKWLATLNDDKLEEFTDPDYTFRYVDIGIVGRGVLTGSPETVRFADAPSRARRRVRDGDVLVSTVRTYLRAVLPIEGPADDLVVSTGFAVVRPTNLDPKFAAWVLQSDTFIEEVVARSVGVSYPAVNPSELGLIEVPVPAASAQRSIAHFLDTETARLDAVIAKKRQMIDLLAERRTALMAAGCSGLVTKPGPTVKSTLAWLTDIPAHWREVRLSLVARLGSGHTPSRSRPEWWVDCSIPWITTGEVARLRSDEVEYIDETRECISEVGLANSSAELHPAETVVLCRTASAGYSGIMRGPMATSQDFATWTCGPLLRPRFLLLCLRAMRPDLLGRLAMGSTHKTIYMPDIESIRVPLPPLDEQDQVVKATWERLNKITSISQRLDSQLRLLQEHRQTLITSVVNGLVDVRRVAS